MIKVYSALAVIILVVMLALSGAGGLSPVMAGGPSPTMRSYSRSVLLSTLGAKSYTITDMSLAFDPGPALAQSGSFFLTYTDILGTTGALGAIVGFFMVIFVLHALVKAIGKMTKHEVEAINANVKERNEHDVRIASRKQVTHEILGKEKYLR